VWQLENWKPKTEEKQMYKPTSKCTLKNIAEKIHETGCSEAKAEFFDVIKVYLFDAGDVIVAIDLGSVHTIESSLFPMLTKTEKRRNWLLQHGFIEEDIKLKPCPLCGETKYTILTTTREMHKEDRYGEGYAVCCNFIKGGCGMHSGYRDTANEVYDLWNTRK
jgi:hypothetical protein